MKISVWMAILWGSISTCNGYDGDSPGSGFARGLERGMRMGQDMEEAKFMREQRELAKDDAQVQIEYRRFAIQQCMPHYAPGTQEFTFCVQELEKLQITPP